jgi:hypothetical protein
MEQRHTLLLIFTLITFFLIINFAIYFYVLPQLEYVWLFWLSFVFFWGFFGILTNYLLHGLGRVFLMWAIQGFALMVILIIQQTLFPVLLHITYSFFGYPIFQCLHIIYLMLKKKNKDGKKTPYNMVTSASSKSSTP